MGKFALSTHIYIYNYHLPMDLFCITFNVWLVFHLDWTNILYNQRHSAIILLYYNLNKNQKNCLFLVKGVFLDV